MVTAIAASAQVPAPSVAPVPARPAATAGQVVANLAATSAQQDLLPRFGFDVPAQPRSPQAGPRRKIVCGMTVIPVGPQADSTMVKPKPDNGVDYSIRRVPPPMCGDSEKK